MSQPDNTIDALIDDLVPAHRQDDFKKAVAQEANKAVAARLEKLGTLVDELDFKKIDRGNEAYNPAFKDFRMGFTTAKGFCQKFITNQIKALTADKEPNGKN